MLLQTTNSLRVAILGSGISGSTAARTLAEKGLQITVFEAGYGIGGRTSTRITQSQSSSSSSSSSSSRYQFDHGAQYISTPKTDTFRKALTHWNRENWIQPWAGNFYTVDSMGVLTKEEEDTKKERWVGYPAMHSICRNLLHHENIQVKLQTRADAVFVKPSTTSAPASAPAPASSSSWELRNGNNQESLGNFDWLIVTDRNSANHLRNDLTSANVKEFKDSIQSNIQTVKSLTAMVVFDRPLNLDMDGIQFNDKGTTFGSLGWVARDTSKPGRERNVGNDDNDNDHKECWVLQTHPDAAEEILNKAGDDLKDIRNMAKKVLVQDFIKSLPLLASKTTQKIDKVPNVVMAMGHRWGAAFPIPSADYCEMESLIIKEKNFVACGDYFGSLSGRVEGAYLSGLSAATHLCNEIQC